MKVLSVTGLSKRYGDIVAVDDLSFEVERNEIVGLLGPNGAGKTTTINMILGVLEPTSGAIYINGLDLAQHRCEALERTLPAPPRYNDTNTRIAELRVHMDTRF